MEIAKIIENNIYVKECKSNKKKDINSLSYLLDTIISQSDCIKLGIGCERILCDFILSNAQHLSNIKPINKKGSKERNHLFIDTKNKIIFYAELKGNINLDTEKSIETSINKNALHFYLLNLTLIKNQ